MTGESNVDDISNDIEDIIYNHLNGVIINLKRYLPNLSQMISPNIGNLVDNFDLIDNEDQSNFKKMHDIGMLNGHFALMLKQANLTQNVMLHILSYLYHVSRMEHINI